jgi:hypothetical protein
MQNELRKINQNFRNNIVDEAENTIKEISKRELASFLC